MGYQLQVRDRATQDLRSHANYISSAGNTDAAVRFLEAAEQTFNQLTETPNIGKVVAIADKAFGDVRQWRIRSFKNHLIFTAWSRKRLIFFVSYMVQGTWAISFYS
ncbi:MAG: type II toxin-antitoxin system RelE/ParE family toxin [Leptolyngbyaceae cyanobacterium]